MLSYKSDFSADGMRSCVLKSQGIAQLLGNNLRGLQQSGDIDVGVDADEEGADVQEAYRWMQRMGMGYFRKSNDVVTARGVRYARGMDDM